MKNKVLLDKIHAILKEKNIKPSRASKEAGLGPDFIRKLKQAKNSPKADTLFKLANYLSVDANYLLDSIEQAAQSNMQEHSHSPQKSQEINPLMFAIETIYIKGYVEAKKWQKEKEWRGFEQLPLTIPKDSNFDSVNRYGLIVNDNSMNLLYPKGSILIASTFENLKRMPENGDSVIVVKYDYTQDAYETTVKIVQIKEDGYVYLWPKTDDPLLLAPTIIPKITLKYYNPIFSATRDTPPDVEIKSLVTSHYQNSRKILI